MTIKLFTLSLFTFGLMQSSITLAHHVAYHKDCVFNAAETLDLNAEQKVKIKLLTHKAKMEITLKHHELHTIRKHVDETFHSGNMNTAKIDKFAKQKERVMGSIAKTRLYARYKIYQSLNAQQKTQMEHKIESCLAAHASQ